MDFAGELKIPQDILIDSLREIGTIGAGHAATSLSGLIGKTVRITVPRVRILDIPGVIDALGGAEAMVTAVFVKILGNLDGSLLILFRPHHASQLTDLLLSRDPEERDEDILEMKQSALKEVGNICSASYLLALSESLKLRSINSVPGRATDLLQSLLDGVLADNCRHTGRVVILETEFEIRDETVRGHLLFIPSQNRLPELFRALQRRIGS